MAAVTQDLRAPTRPSSLFWRRLGAKELDHERVWAGVFLLGLLVAVVTPERLRWGLVCPIKALTGFPCLTCGGNRALSALLRADPVAALRWNPLVALVILLWAAYAVYAAVVVLGRLPRLRFCVSSRRTRPVVLLTLIMVVAANWLYLVVTGV
jgi:hypothetical protein